MLSATFGGRGGYTLSGQNGNGKWDQYKKILIPILIAWMGWVSLTALNGASLTKVSEVLHRRITSTKKELVVERNNQLLELKKEIADLKGEIRELRWMILQFVAKYQKGDLGSHPDERLMK